ncbi:MAG: pilus assembly protein PilM [Candidatus Liptonbacteria bacterium]|nr:pilus assembly protein PilM [Candidatus Liptonbacteria bacterium]
MPLNNFFKKTLILLRAKSVIAGLEVSDSALRLAYFHGERLELVSFRLPPGILEAGKIKNREEFSQILKKFKDQVSVKIGVRGKINVIVCLSSVNIYTQVFDLPFIQGENFEKAVDLNLKMVSPEKSEEIYSGWQVISEDKNNLKMEVLSAFLSRALVDEMTSVLSQAEFFVLAIESRSFALSRLIRKLAIGFDSLKPYAVISLDNNALDFIVLRRAPSGLKFLRPALARAGHRAFLDYLGA